MSHVRSWFNKYYIAVQVILILMGFALVLLSSTLPPQSMQQTASFSLGVAIVSGTFVAIFQVFMGTDIKSVIQESLEFQRHVSECGLKDVALKLGGEELYDKLADAHTIDLMYNTSRNMTTRYGQQIMAAIANHGCRVRVLISNPESSLWLDSAMTNALCPGTNVKEEIRDVINHWTIYIQRVIESSPTPKSGSLEIRYYSCVPTCSFVLIDDLIGRIITYLPYSHSSEVPVFDVVHTAAPNLHDSYRRTFDTVWSHSKQRMCVEFSHNGLHKEGID